jgi:NADPH2:quinone reductase
MRAVVIERLLSESEVPQALRVAEHPDPVVAAHQIGVRVEAAGCNFSDLLIARGRYQVKPPLPFVLGAEVAGVVDAVGASVTDFRAGDRVFAAPGIGAFAERIALDAARARRLPDALSFAEGAAIQITHPTAYAALVDRAALVAGETCLVHAAAGGTGLAAVEIAAALGARVIATAGSAEKCALAREHGASEAIDYQREDFVARVLEITHGRGADVIFDSVGGDTTSRSLRCIAWKGRLVVIGFSSGEIPELALSRVMLKNIAVTGLHWSAYPEREPARVDAIFGALFELQAAGRIRPRVSARYPLECVADALAALATRKSVGKLVLEPQRRVEAAA